MSELAATPEVMPATTRPVTLAPTARGGGVNALLGQARTFAAQPAVAKSLPAIGLIALLGLAAMIWMAFSAPPSRSLFSGLADQDKAAVADALNTAGIPYKLDRTTGALSVSDADYYQAKMLLASQGLPKSAPDGNEMISNLPLGASRAVEGERLRGAREMDLARTIEAIDAVQSARVHLAVEAPSVFLRDRSKRSASVMLNLAAGRTLSDAQVQAIVHLVASSVPGLSPDGVSVVDQTGRLLSSGDGEGVGAVSDRQVAVQAKVESRYRDTLNALLTPIVGAGNFTAEVHADVDFSESQSTREGYPQDQSAVRSEERAWTSRGGGEEAAGIPGTLSNEAPTASTVAAAPGATLDPQTPGAEVVQTAAKTAENYTRNYALGREVSVTRRPTGEVKRLSVAVALKAPANGQPRSRQELAEIDALVKGAVGFDATRGDVVALSSRAFAPVEEAQGHWWEADWVAMLARNLTALGLAALLVFGVARPLLRKRAAGAKAAPAVKASVGNEIAAALADRGQPSESDITLSMIESAPSYEARAVLIRNFVRQDPARAALVVRDLLRADKAEGVDKNG